MLKQTTIMRHDQMLKDHQSLTVNGASPMPVEFPFLWLALAWRDIVHDPWPSLIYGLAVAGICALLIWAMLIFGWDQILFPALSGLLIIGPVLATGLYKKSRAQQSGKRLPFLALVWPGDGVGKHILFIGAILTMLMLAWMRAAVLLFALFWGWRPLPPLEQLVAILLYSPQGWLLLTVGTLVGGLFAALGFSISVFSIPMVLDRKIDAFTAMGVSIKHAWKNLAAMTVWGSLVLTACILSFATGFLALILVFPLLGHATWHAYAALLDQHDDLL